MAEKIIYQSLVLPNLDNELLERAIAGDVVIYWNDQKIPLKLNRQDCQSLAIACDVGYLVKGKAKRVALGWAYFYRRENAKLPIVVARTRNKYASIEMDLVCCAHLTPFGVGRVRDLFGYESPHARAYSAGHTYSHIAKIESENVDRVARCLLEIWRLNHE
jgi:hypothetical protein